MDFNQDQTPVQTPPQPNSDNRGMKPIVKFISLVLIVAISYMAGFNSGKKGFTFVPKDFKIVNQTDQPQVVDYKLLWDAINVVNTKYIDKPVDPQKVLYGATSGAVAAAGDPYTTFFPPQDLQNFKTSLQGNFDGIGAEIGSQNGNIVIVAPLDGTPAQKAGLRPKDIIAGVDGK